MGKSLWSFRTKFTAKYRIHSVVAITIAYAIDYLAADYVIDLLNIPDGPTQDLLDDYFVIPLIAVGIWLAAVLNREQ